MNPARNLQINFSLPDYLGATLFAAFLDPGVSRAIVPGQIGGRREIGVYEATLAPGELERLYAKIAEVDMWRLPSPSMFEPDVPLVRIFEVAGGTTVPERDCAWPAPGLPDELAPIMTLLQELVATLQRHPRRVLAGEAKWVHSQVRANDTPEIDVVLKNVGSEELTFASPLMTEEGAIPTLELLLRPVSALPSELHTRALRIPISPLAVTSVPTAPRRRRPDEAAGPMITLPPGASAGFLLKPSARISPDRYDAVLMVRSLSGRAPRASRVEGQLSLELSQLVVTP